MKRLFNLLFSLLFFVISCSSDHINNKKPEKNIYLDKAYYFIDNGIVDSAFFYFNVAKDMYQAKNDSLGIAKCLINMAIISTDKADYFGGQEFSIDAIPFLNTKDLKHHPYIISNLNNLGIASSSLGNYLSAINFYKETLQYTSDSASILVVENNIAYAYQQDGNYKESTKLYQAILKKPIKDRNEYARILSNSANTNWLQNPNYNPVPEFLKALQIRNKENNLADIYASFAYLANYYTKKNTDSALLYALKMNRVTSLNNNAEDKLLALQMLVKLSRPQDTKRYFLAFEKLNDSLSMARAAAKNQFALIRYETEKHKANNLLLKQENNTKKYQLIILIFIVLITSITGILWYKKRKQKIALETANTIKKNQLKTSKKVHDVVANGLYRIMTKLDNNEKLNDDTIVDEIEELYEKSRDISYEKVNATSANFKEKLTSLLTSFAAVNTKVLIIGNHTNMWLNVNDKVKYELENILQELMVNMRKHSQAKNVIIKFSVLNHQIIINYKDDGFGMPQNINFNNGLTNTGNRINSLSGVLNFEPYNGKGLKILIILPIT